MYRSKEYIVYMVRCNDDSYYTGITNDLERRLQEHNEGIDTKCYTYKRRPVELVYNCAFREVLDAIAAEKQIKGWSRKKKEVLIEGKFELLSLFSENERQRRVRSVRDRIRECMSTKAGVMLRSLEA